MATNPGVRVLYVDGFIRAAEDDSELASRMLVVARAAIAGDAEWRTSVNGQALYNPTLYKTESEVVKDWGAGSDAHVAFVQAVKAGAVNVYLSVTDPDPVEPGQNDPGAGYSADEYEVFKALEFAEVARPDVIALFGYHANEQVASDAYYAAVPAARCAKYAAILATACRDLAQDVNHAMGFISPVDSVTHLTALGRTVTAGALSAADVAAYVAALKEEKHVTFNYTAGDPLPIEEVNAVVDAVDADDDLGKFLVIPVNEVTVVGQPRDEVGGTVAFKPCATVVAAHTQRIGVSKAITLDPIQNVQNVQFNLTKSQRSNLMDLKTVPVALNNRRNVATIDGITFAKNDTDGDPSVYGRLFNMMVVGEVARITRRVIEPYIGKSAGVALLNSLETQLRARFLELKQFEVAREVRFTFRFSPVTNKLTVSEIVKPNGELRDVEVNVSVEL